MTETPAERLAAAAKSLMVVHGAAMATLVSLLGTAVDSHPELYNFMANPLLFSALGFAAALAAYQFLAFNPPSGKWGAAPWALTFGSGGLVLGVLFTGGMNFLVLMAKAKGLI